MNNTTTKDLQPIIIIEQMNKWYGDFHVLKNINLRVKPGERIVICGPSGSGKSTLIRCINRLEEHESGEIIVDNIRLIDDMNERFPEKKQSRTPCTIWRKYGLPNRH